MRRERVLKNYEDKNRLIESGVYNELKHRKKCGHCHKGFGGQIPEIHHKIPLSKGGTNDINNLVAVHSKCHRLLDAKEGVGNGETKTKVKT